MPSRLCPEWYALPSTLRQAGQYITRLAYPAGGGFLGAAPQPTAVTKQLQAVSQHKLTCVATYWVPKLVQSHVALEGVPIAAWQQVLGSL